MTGAERHRHLVRGLVGDDHLAEYQTSAAFHAVVDQLASMLPMWVQGLAALARQEDAEIHRVAQLIEAGASPKAPDTPLSDLIFPERDR